MRYFYYCESHSIQLKKAGFKMASTNQRQLLARAKKKANVPSRNSGTVGELVIQSGKVKIFRANQISLDNYKKATGYLPYVIELLEECALRIHEEVIEKELGQSITSLSISSWRDYILEVDSKCYGFRVKMDNADKEFERPAYGDKVSLTAIEAGIARMMITAEVFQGFCYHRGSGPKKWFQAGPLSCGINLEQAANMARAVFQYRVAFSGNLTRFLD